MGCYGSKEHQAAEKRPRREEPQVEETPANREAAERSKKALRSLLATKDRDYLVDRAGKKVKVDQLRGKPVGLLFSAFAVPPAREFTKQLTETYNELKSKGKAFEVIFLHNDQSQEIWKQSMKEMGWLAVPFSDQSTGDTLGQMFSVVDIPTLVLLDAEGNSVTGEGVEIVKIFGAKAWPFSEGRLRLLRSSQGLGPEPGKRSNGGSWRDTSLERGQQAEGSLAERRSYGEEHVKDCQVAPADYDPHDEA